jgi:hypothetical protein
MLKKMLLMSVILLAVAYPQRPVVMGDPFPTCPPACDGR